MPPSGYSKKQSESIVDFLKSVSDSLKMEGISFELSPIEALNKEINNINEIVVSEQFNIMSNIVLELTKWFYQRILEFNPLDYEIFIEIRDKIIVEVASDILAIHVPKIGVES